MKLLAEQITSHRVILHITDITLLEIKRQIRERVLSRQRELSAIEKDLKHWRKLAPSHSPNGAFELDAEKLAKELFDQLWSFLLSECDARVHKALELAPAVVFQSYFDRNPPFDGNDSKEFPDGFVLEVLKQWCEKEGKKLLVVTEDKAMIRTIAANEKLLHLKDIHELLARAAADLGAEGEAAGEDALNGPSFDFTFEAALAAQLGEAVFVYYGDLPDGEAYNGKLLSIEEVDGWSTVALSEDRVTLILNAKVRVQVEIQFEDLDGATYDREDGRWFGAETTSTEVEDEVHVEVLVEIERKDGRVHEAKILDQEIIIYGPSDLDY